jgi:hypothetical protein
MFRSAAACAERYIPFLPVDRTSKSKVEGFFAGAWYEQRLEVTG